MKRNTSARVAGATFLLYIAVAFPTGVLVQRATRGDGIAERLARVASHAADLRWAIFLTILSCFAAVVLAVTLYGLTREEDPDLAMATFASRTCEGVLGMLGIPKLLQLISLSAVGHSQPPGDPAIAGILGTLLLMPGGGVMLGAPFFALGSLAFSCQCVRRRIVPSLLAWIGVLASAQLLICLPLQVAGMIRGSLVMWMPMLAFEVPLGLWLLFKGASDGIEGGAR